MDTKTYLAESERVPAGFAAIAPADHPTKPGTSGLLCRNRATGIYVLVVGGATIGVPRKWAADLAAEHGKPADAIQDRCIARMGELGLTAADVARAVEGRVSKAHVYDYLTRKASIGSHKLQHVLDALKLRIAEA